MKVENCRTAANLATWYGECKKQIDLLDSSVLDDESIGLIFPRMDAIQTKEPELIKRVTIIARHILSSELRVLEGQLRVLGVEVPSDESPSTKAA